MIENDKIVVAESPLFDMEGIIMKIDKRKGRVKVDFLINENVLGIDSGIKIIKKI